MMIEQEEFLLRIPGNKVYERLRFLHKRGGREHQIDEKHEVSVVHLREGLKVHPCFVIASAPRIDDGLDLEAFNSSEIPPYLFGDEVAICVGMADNVYIVYRSTYPILGGPTCLIAGRFSGQYAGAGT